MASKAERLRQNNVAKRLSMFMQSKLRGVTFTTFSALTKNRDDNKFERAQMEVARRALREHMRAADEKAELFSMGKEDRRVGAAWGMWVRQVFQTKVNALYAKCKREEGARYRVEQTLASMQKNYEMAKAETAQIQMSLDGGNAQCNTLVTHIEQQQEEIELLKQQHFLMKVKVWQAHICYSLF